MLRTFLAIACVAAALVPAASAATEVTGGGVRVTRVEIVRDVRPRAGFRIIDAGIGAAFTAVLAAVGGAGIIVHRSRVRAA